MQHHALAKPAPPASIVTRRIAAWSRTPEGMIVALTLVGQAALHLLLLLFMPLAYYSELSGHDGDSYYALAYDPLPTIPAFSLMRYKRVAFALLARAAGLGDAHIGFAVVGIVAAALANLYFYRIAAKYTATPLPVTLVFAYSPYVFAAVHVALPDPLSIACILAALACLLEDRFRGLVIWSALALLFKEVAIGAVLALAVLWLLRKGWRSALWYLVLVSVPSLIVVAVYALAWHDPFWYFKESRTTLVPAPLTLIRLLTASTSSLIVRLDSAINFGILTILGVALWRLRRIDRTLLVFVIVSILPLLFLDERQYASDFDMARQYMVAAPALVAFADGVNRLRRRALVIMLASLGSYSMYYILSVSKFFVVHKQAILNLLSFL